MGSNFYCLSSKTSFEIIIDDIFTSLPLRYTPLNDILNMLDENIAESGNLKYLNDTGFQKVYNIYAVDPDKIEVFNLYWSNVKKYMNKRKTLCLYLIICLLSKYDLNNESVEKFYNIFIKLIEIPNNPLYIQAKDLHDMICKYICAISYLAVEPFKIYSDQQIEFTYFLKNSWNPDKIHNYVWKRYFKGMKTLNITIDVYKFLSLNLKSLSDDVELRRSLTNYVIKNQDEIKIV